MSAGGPPWTLPPISPPSWLTTPAGSGASGDAKPDSGTFAVPAELKAGLKDAWDASFPHGKSQEHGGILVRKADGTLEWRAGNAGTSGTFQINYGDLKSGETLVASAHTHPYDASEGGHRDVPFSGGDLANMVTGAESQKFVQSGDSVFRAAKTEEFEKLVKASNPDTLKTEMKATFNTALGGATGSFQDRVEAGVKAVCEKYHLEYFKGTGDSLTRVDTSK